MSTRRITDANIRRIRQAAKNLLVAASIDSRPVNLAAIANAVGAEIRDAKFDDDVAGMLFRENGKCIIGVNKSHGFSRQRFTIAHELGHLTLHSENLYVDRQYTIRMRDRKSSLAMDTDEIEANSFAAELLMPTFMLSEDIKGITIDYEDGDEIRKLADLYKVSSQAMTFRLTNLGLIEPHW